MFIVQIICQQITSSGKNGMAIIEIWIILSNIYSC